MPPCGRLPDATRSAGGASLPQFSMRIPSSPFRPCQPSGARQSGNALLACCRLGGPERVRDIGTCPCPWSLNPGHVSRVPQHANWPVIGRYFPQRRIWTTGRFASHRRPDKCYRFSFPAPHGSDHNSCKFSYPWLHCARYQRGDLASSARATCTAESSMTRAAAVQARSPRQGQEPQKRCRRQDPA